MSASHQGKNPGPLHALIACCLLHLSGCSRDIHDHPELTTGKQLFEYHCAECHQLNGQGNFILGVPSNRDTELLAYQVAHKIRNGSNESRMPDFPNMGKEEAVKIAVYLKSIGYGSR